MDLGNEDLGAHGDYWLGDNYYGEEFEGEEIPKHRLPWNDYDLIQGLDNTIQGGKLWYDETKQSHLTEDVVDVEDATPYRLTASLWNVTNQDPKDNLLVLFEIDEDGRCIVTSIKNIDSEITEDQHGLIQRHPDQPIYQMFLRQVPSIFTEHEMIEFLFTKTQEIVNESLSEGEDDDEAQKQVESNILKYFHKRFITRWQWEMCPICHEDFEANQPFGGQTVFQECQHSVCTSCFKLAVSLSKMKKCPICKGIAGITFNLPDTPYQTINKLLKNLVRYHLGEEFPVVTGDFTEGYDRGGRIRLKRPKFTLADKIGLF